MIFGGIYMDGHQQQDRVDITDLQLSLDWEILSNCYEKEGEGEIPSLL